MSKRSEQQFEEIIIKLDQLLEENSLLKQQNAQKDDEFVLQKEQIEYLFGKLYGRKRNLSSILTKAIYLMINFLANQSRLENKTTNK